MAIQIIINLLLPFPWMFLNNSWTFGSFLSGYVIGLGILYLVRGFFPKRFYFITFIAIIKLILIFIKELFLSTIQVVSQVLRPRLDIRPGIFAMDIDLKDDWEVTLLSCLITLTPGTLVVDVSPDSKTLYIHSLDLEDVNEEKQQIENSFIKAMQEVRA